MELHERLAQAGSESALLNGNVDPFAEVKNKIHLAIVSELGPRLFEAGDSGSARVRVEDEVRAQLKQETGLSREDRERIASEISDDIFGYGPLERLLPDQTISEIMVNGPHEIWIERRGLLSRIPLRFSDESHLRRIITKMVGQVGRRIDESSPMVEARLPDGSRIHAVIPPLSLSGPLLTIRKFARNRYALDELIDIGTVSPEAATLLSAGVKADLNMLISGGTGTGKTTLLNALSASVPEGDRTITIEDAAELQLSQEHVLRLEARPKNIEGEGEVTIRDLVRTALRMRPDRIIVGEVRGAEALDMLQAMNTGHEGSLSTIHANSTRDALSRLETMVLMAGYDLPVKAIRGHVSSALDVIVQLERLDDGSRRVTAIAEVQRMEGDTITLQNLFEFHVERVEADRTVVGQLLPTGIRPSFFPKFARHGIELPPDLFGTPLAAMYGADAELRNHDRRAAGGTW